MPAENPCRTCEFRLKERELSTTWAQEKASPLINFPVRTVTLVVSSWTQAGKSFAIPTTRGGYSTGDTLRYTLQEDADVKGWTAAAIRFVDAKGLTFESDVVFER